MVHACNSSYEGDKSRKITIQGWSWERIQDPIQKIAKAKNDWDCASVSRPTAKQA